MSTSQIAMSDGSDISAAQHKRNSISPSPLILESNRSQTPSSLHERHSNQNIRMSYNYQYQQPEQAYHNGSIYGSNTSATAGGSYQLGAQPGYNSVPYGSSGNQSSGVLGGSSGQQGVQNPQYPSGYGGQQTYNPSYASYYAGSTSTTSGVDPYTGLATTQTTMAQAPSSMASGYSSGQSTYYSNGIPTSSPPSYGGAQSASSLYSSQSATTDYPYGAGYSSGVRSASGSMEGYAPYPATNAPSNVHQSPYGSTYPTSHDSVSSTSTALGAVATMPVPLAPVSGATGGVPQNGDDCLIM